MPMIKKYFILLPLLSAVLFYTCAVQRSPGGGPLDRTPPEIIYTFPAKDSLRIGRSLQSIEIRFSERMDQSSLNNHIYISPPLAFEAQWDGWEKLNLILADSLLAKQTYVVAIGAGAADLRKNRMKASYQFAFSTGDYIDKGRVSGKVFGRAKEEPLHIFAYALANDAPFDPTREKPLYISQSGPDGAYQLDYLKMNRYRLLAVDDQNHNLLLDSDVERVGLPFRDVRLDSLHPAFRGLDFQLSLNDTTPPRVMSVRSQNNTSVQVRLSEALPLDEKNPFILRDSLSQRKIPLLGFSRDMQSAQSVLLFSDSLDTAAVYSLQILSLQDSAGNVNDSLPVFSLRASAKKDTVSFRLLEHIPEDSTKNLLPDADIRFKFSRPLDSLSLKKACLLISAGQDTIDGEWFFPNLYQARFRPQPRLQPDSAYFSQINMRLVRDLWGKMLADSTEHHYFTIVSSRELGELSGEVLYKGKEKAPAYVNIRSLKRGIKPLLIKADAQYHFYVPDLKEASYLIDGFLDLDHDGKFSAGKLKPFKYSEPFHFNRDTFKVRKRWETSGIKLMLPPTEDE